MEVFDQRRDERLREITDGEALQEYEHATPHVDVVEGVSIVEPLAPMIMKPFTLSEQGEEYTEKREVLAIRVRLCFLTLRSPLYVNVSLLGPRGALRIPRSIWGVGAWKVVWRYQGLCLRCECDQHGHSA